MMKMFALLSHNSPITTVISKNAKEKQEIEREIRRKRCSKIVGF